MWSFIFLCYLFYDWLKPALKIVPFQIYYVLLDYLIEVCFEMRKNKSCWCTVRCFGVQVRCRKDHDPYIDLRGVATNLPHFWHYNDQVGRGERRGCRSASRGGVQHLLRASILPFFPFDTAQYTRRTPTVTYSRYSLWHHRRFNQTSEHRDDFRDLPSPYNSSPLPSNPSTNILHPRLSLKSNWLRCNWSSLFLNFSCFLILFFQPTWTLL